MNFFKNFQHIFFTFLVTCVVLFIYRFPDVYANFNTPKGMIFLGQNPWFDSVDVSLYISAIRYGQLGHILLPNLYTSLPNKPIFLYPLYTFLGYVFRLENPFFIFFIASIVIGALLVSGFYLMIKSLGFSTKFSLFTCFVICLGGGFGFILYPYITSADMGLAITFYDTFLKPHEGLAIFSYILFFIMFYKTYIQQVSGQYSNVRLFIISGSLTLLMIFYPYFILNCFLVAFSFFFFSKKGKLTRRDFLHIIIPYIPAGIVALIIANQFTMNNTFSRLTQHTSTDFWLTILGCGILLPLIFFQLFFLKKSQLEKYLLVWVLITLGLAILPFGPGKIFIRGLFFPLVFSSVLAIRTLITKYHISTLGYQVCIFGLFLVLTIGTSVNIFILRMNSISEFTNSSQNLWTYMPQDDYKIFKYLNSQIPPMKSILSGYVLGNQIPAFTHDTVYIGHFGQTPYVQDKLDNVRVFYSGLLPNDEVTDILKTNNISYVVWGPKEKEITSKYYSKRVTSLTAIYKNLKFVYKTGNIELYSTN